jgi:hypothetical protein
LRSDVGLEMIFDFNRDFFVSQFFYDFTEETGRQHNPPLAWISIDCLSSETGISVSMEISESLPSIRFHFHHADFHTCQNRNGRSAGNSSLYLRQMLIRI